MAALVGVLTGLPAFSLSAQSAEATSAAVDRAIGRARALLDEGDGAEARAVLDSLVRVSPVGSNDFAEALYWRAALSEQVRDAVRDWKRLTIEAPLSPRASDAMVRLGEVELLRGRPAEARVYYERVLREYPGGAARIKSQLGIVKSYSAENDLPRACGALADVMATGVPEGELQLQADEMRRRCLTVEPKPKEPKPKEPQPKEPKPKEAKRPVNARFSVQLAAFDTRAEADDAVARLMARIGDVRVDGDTKPFRVRTGYFATRAEANARLVKLKRQGQTGFVAEIVQ